MKYVWIFLQSAWLITFYKSFQHLYEGSNDITPFDAVIIQNGFKALLKSR